MINYLNIDLELPYNPIDVLNNLDLNSRLNNLDIDSRSES